MESGKCFTSKKLYWDIITVHNAFFKLYSHFSTILFATLIRWGEPTRAGFYFNSKPPWTQHSPRGPPAFLTLSLSIYPTPHCSRQHHTKWKIKKIEWKIRQEHKDTFHVIQYWDSTGPKYKKHTGRLLLLAVILILLMSSLSFSCPLQPPPVLRSDPVLLSHHQSRPPSLIPITSSSHVQVLEIETKNIYLWKPFHSLYR